MNNGKRKKYENNADEEQQNVKEEKNEETEDILIINEDKKSISESEFEKLNLNLKEKDEEIRQLNEQIKRMQADFENHKRRLEEYYNQLQEYTGERLICELLPFIDNLERAVVSAEKNKNKGEDYKSFLEGIELILRQIHKILEREGVSIIESCGKVFDPSCHEVMMKEDTNEVEDDTILEELQKGYCYKNKVIRPSLVKVAKNLKGGN